MHNLEPGMTLYWKQPTARRALHELWLDDALVATLELSGASGEARSEAGTWRLEGDITRALRVWDSDRGELVAELNKGSWSGSRTLQTADGATFAWLPANFWRTAWRFVARDGAAAIVFGRGRGIVRATGTIEVGAAVVSQPMLQLLAIVARYIILMSDRDGSAAAVAGIVPSI